MSAGESKLKAAAAELRASEASKEGLRRELTACEGRLEESARLLASNQQVIKWLNKELNDAQMVPGGVTAAAAAAVSEAGLAYGGQAPSSSPLGDYDFGGGAGLGDGGGGGGGGRSGKDVMFTTGIRESLIGGVSWNLRGTTLDRGGGGGGGMDQNGEYVPREDDGAAAAVREEVPSNGGGGVESTPDHAGRRSGGGSAGGVGGRGGYSRVVTPESAGVPDPAQASSRFLSQADETISKGDWYEDGGGGGGGGGGSGGDGGRDDELAVGRGRLGGGPVRGIRAF